MRGERSDDAPDRREPVPEEAKDTLPGFCFTYSTNSFRLFAGKSGRVTSALGVRTATESRSKSFCVE